MLGSFLIFQGIQNSIAKKLYVFANFQGGGGGQDPLSPPPSGSTHDELSGPEAATFWVWLCLKSDAPVMIIKPDLNSKTLQDHGQTKTLQTTLYTQQKLQSRKDDFVNEMLHYSEN